MNWDDYNKVLLALVGWRESRSDGMSAIQATMCVIRNRVKAGWHHGQWSANIVSGNPASDKPHEFSSMTILGDKQTVAWPDERPDADDRMFPEVLQLAERVYAGTETDTTGGALYYGNVPVIKATAPNGWFMREVVNKVPTGEMIHTRDIGKHSFYRPT